MKKITVTENLKKGDQITIQNGQTHYAGKERPKRFHFRVFLPLLLFGGYPGLIYCVYKAVQWTQYKMG